jgi:hypothetical protein
VRSTFALVGAEIRPAGDLFYVGGTGIASRR